MGAAAASLRVDVVKVDFTEVGIGEWQDDLPYHTLFVKLKLAGAAKKLRIPALKKYHCTPSLRLHGFVVEKEVDFQLPEGADDTLDISLRNANAPHRSPRHLWGSFSGRITQLLSTADSMATRRMEVSLRSPKTGSIGAKMQIVLKWTLLRPGAQFGKRGGASSGRRTVTMHDVDYENADYLRVRGAEVVGSSCEVKLGMGLPWQSAKIDQLDAMGFHLLKMESGDTRWVKLSSLPHRFSDELEAKFARAKAASSGGKRSGEGESKAAIAIVSRTSSEDVDDGDSRPISVSAAAPEASGMLRTSADDARREKARSVGTGDVPHRLKRQLSNSARFPRAGDIRHARSPSPAMAPGATFHAAAAFHAPPGAVALPSFTAAVSTRLDKPVSAEKESGVAAAAKKAEADRLKSAARGEAERGKAAARAAAERAEAAARAAAAADELAAAEARAADEERRAAEAKARAAKARAAARAKAKAKAKADAAAAAGTAAPARAAPSPTADVLDLPMQAAERRRSAKLGAMLFSMSMGSTATAAMPSRAGAVGRTRSSSSSAVLAPASSAAAAAAAAAAMSPSASAAGSRVRSGSRAGVMRARSSSIDSYGRSSTSSIDSASALDARDDAMLDMRTRRRSRSEDSGSAAAGRRTLTAMLSSRTVVVEEEGSEEDEEDDRYAASEAVAEAVALPDASARSLPAAAMTAEQKRKSRAVTRLWRSYHAGAATPVPSEAAATAAAAAMAAMPAVSTSLVREESSAFAPEPSVPVRRMSSVEFAREALAAALCQERLAVSGGAAL